MNNLIIAVLAVAFAAALSLAGVNFVDRGADIAHTEQVNNTVQIESMVADYESLRQNVGRRPTNTDYSSVYTTGSDKAYAYDAGGNVTTPSRMTGTPGQWTYMPGCNGGAQDCFYLKVQGSSDIIYRAAKQSAMQELNSPTSSRIELSATQADDPNALTDPHSWPTSTPSTYYLTLRLNSGNVTVAGGTPLYYYTAVPVYSLLKPACGATNKTLTSWTCVQSPGGTVVDQSNCASEVPSKYQPTTDMTGCVVYTPTLTGGGTCSNSVFTPNWACVSSNGSVVADKYCGSYTPPTYSCGTGGTVPGSGSPPVTGGGGGTTSPTGPTGGSGGGTASYSYLVSNIQYSTCKPACGSSTQPVTGYTCTRSDGTPELDLSLCGTPPSAACTDYSTCTVQSPVYGTCSNQCGTGTAQLTSYQCGDASGNFVDDSHCTAPPASEACSSTHGCTYTWSNANYLSCMPACGISSEPINLADPGTCTRSDGTVVNPSYCYYAGEISTSQKCYNYSLCAAGPHYGDCSNTCGAGTQTLTGSDCTDSAGNPLPPGDCSTPAPVRACVGTSTCTYTASAPVYNTCSSSCGDGLETVASFTCTRSDGTVVAQSNCKGQEPPAQTCSAYTSCQVANASYGACSNQCGAGTQTLQNSNWTCSDGNGNTVDRSHCTPPAGTRNCYGTNSCTYAPANVTYGACQAACGSSTEALSWTCQRSDGTTVAQSNCTPPPTVVCTDHSQCTARPVYTSCSTTCGSGTESLQSNWTCVGPDGTPAPDGQSDCATPPATKSCTNASGCIYTAHPVYGACVAGCGASTQPLTSWTCQDQNGNVVDSSLCTAPANSIACTDNTACGDIVYFAQVDSSGSCQQANCGGSSTLQVLTWHCEKYNYALTPSDQGQVDQSYCTAPAGSYCVYTANCYSYSYQNATYGACSTTCGPGTQSLQSYDCYRSDPNGGTIQVTDEAHTPGCAASNVGVPTSRPCQPANPACP